MNELTGNTLKYGKTWLKHLFFALVYKKPDSEVWTWNYAEYDIDELFREPWMKVYNMLENQTWDPDNEIDNEIKTIASIELSDRNYGRFNGSSERIKFSEEEIAAMLADMCNKCKIFWNDGSRTKYEIEYFKKSILGKALWEFGCFESLNGVKPNVTAKDYNVATPAANNAATAASTTQTAQAKQTVSTQAAPSQSSVQSSPSQQTAATQPALQNTSTQQAASANSAQTATATTNKSISQRAAQAPRNTTNDWRSRGPLSDRVHGLVGKPHVKATADSSIVYKIIDESAKVKNKEFRAYIRPTDGFLGKDNKNQVLVGTTHVYGYTDCYFDNKSDADTFMAQVQNKFPNGNFELRSVKADPNGYFLVDTEFGIVAIRAHDLNEELREEIEYEIEANQPYEHEFSPRSFESRAEYDKITEELFNNFNRFID